MNRILLMGVIVMLNVTAMAADNTFISKKSPYTVAQTIDRLEGVLKEKGIAIVARVNHAAAAKHVAMEMRDTELLIFANPKLGTPLMLENQIVAIDLPMKAIAWKDDKGQVWIGYNDPVALAKQRDLKGQDEILNKMRGALDNFTNAAIAAK